MINMNGKSLLKLLVLTTLAISLIQGDDELYSNSYISPKSPAEIGDPGETIDIEYIHPMSENMHGIQSEGNELKSSALLHDRLERSAKSLLSKSNDGDNYIMYKNIEEALDSNDVELSGRHLVISPSRTKNHLLEKIQSSTTVSFSGEKERALHGRLLEELLSITPTAKIPHQNTASLYNHLGTARQVNPDIQDIITGIVKLLNGNVNVQADTVHTLGKPNRPLSSRINNRGPPRINDLPALPPDFDVPAPPLPPPPLSQMPPPAPPVTSNRLPTPYPFDFPPPSPVRTHSDQMSGNKRPGIYRPTIIPPWNNRLTQRRPEFANRRPNPIPSYKPLPSDYISLTTEEPLEDILNLDLDLHSNNEQDISLENVTIKSQRNNSIFEPDLPEISTSMILQTSDVVDNDTEFEKNKGKITKKDKYSAKTTSITPTVPLKRPELVDIFTTSSQSTLSSFDISSVIIEAATNASSEHLTATKQTTEINEISTTPTQIIKRTRTPVMNESIFQSDEINTQTTSVSLIESSVTKVLLTDDADVMETSNNDFSSTSELPPVASTSLYIESDTTAVQSTSNHSKQDSSYYPYRPRPGIVLDDTEYKPGALRPPINTKPPMGQLADIFDITVSAIQGPSGSTKEQGKPFIIPVDIENVYIGQDVITSLEGDNGLVSIDGKRTYLNLFGNVEATTVTPENIMHSGETQSKVTGTVYAIPEAVEKKAHIGSVKPTQSQRRPFYGRPKPTHPTVRIDTCIVGDDSTCDASQHEMCLTESGISACHCRPGFVRKKHRDVCRKIVSVLLSLRIDRIHERRILWANDLGDRSSESYQQLAYEAEKAIESAMSMTPFSDEYVGAKVNSIYSGERSAGQAGVFVNLTLNLEENSDTSRPTVRGDIQKHLLGVIQRRSNNVGKSAIWVDSPPGSVSNLQDLDECSSPELHDCHQLAKCVNVFGGFKCECGEGYRDQFLDSRYRAGRYCEQCPSQYCNNRGECKYQNGHEVCECSGNYYGNQCELDGEVLGVAIGASVAAIIIIGLTLVALVMWSRKWQREQKATVGSPVFGYMAASSNTVKAPIVGGPPYQMTIEDRVRWAQLADVMAQANHYAPEPVASPRPASVLFGYPSFGSVQRNSMPGTLPPVPLPRLTLQAQIANRAVSLHGGMKQFENSSSSEEEDKTDLLGRSFQVPRPKSRSNASIANQSGIYYDVDYDQNDIYDQGGSIQMNTYSMGRPAYLRN